MQEDFDLETILSIITGINCTNDFFNVYELFWFIFEDPMIDSEKIVSLREIAKNHLLKIHPMLRRVKYDKNIPIDEWIRRQKILFGNSLTVSIIGEPVIRLEKKSYVSMR